MQSGPFPEPVTRGKKSESQPPLPPPSHWGCPAGIFHRGDPHPSGSRRKTTRDPGQRDQGPHLAHPFLSISCPLPRAPSTLGVMATQLTLTSTIILAQIQDRGGRVWREGCGKRTATYYVLGQWFFSLSHPTLLFYKKYLGKPPYYPELGP